MSGWSANTGPMDVETMRGISHKASYRWAEDGNVQKGQRPSLSTLQGFDQPTRAENKHVSVWVDTEPITGNVTHINTCKKKKKITLHNTCRCLQQIRPEVLG